MDQIAEMAIIKALISGLTTEVADAVPFFLLQSEEAQSTAKLIYSMDGAPTFNTMIKDRRFNKEYLYNCYYSKCDVEDIPYYADKLKLAYAKKLAYEHIDNLQTLIESKECTLDKLVSSLRNGMDVDFIGRENKNIVMPEEYAPEHYEQILEETNNPTVKKGIHLKQLPQLDNTFYGLKGGDLILACAQSGHGKTALALNIVDDLSVDQGHIGYYGNAEMALEELTGRIVSKRAIIPAAEVFSRNFVEVSKETALSKLSEQYEILRNSGLILSKIPIMNVATLRSSYRKLANGGKAPRYILVDYIGRMEPVKDTRGLQEWQTMYLIAEELKTLAVELDIPIIALAQLNEDGKIEGAKKMKNACDGVLFFEPITKDDEEHMNETQKKFANYRLEKYKVRRNDNSKPIYINFTKKYQRIAEVF